jgi:hypothetical protein
MTAAWLVAILISAEASPPSDALVPYRMSMRVAATGATGIAGPWWDDLRTGLHHAARRVRGEAWQLTIDAVSIEALNKNPSNGEKADKVYAVRLDRPLGSAQLLATVREYDAILQAWGPPWQRSLATGETLPESLFALVDRAHRPVARVLGRQQGQVEISLRASALLPQSSGAQPAADGLPMTIVRLLGEPDALERSVVNFSYLVYRAPATSGSFTQRADTVSVFRDPTTRRSRKRMEIWAVGSPVSPSGRTELEFRTLTGDRPIAGYEVAVRPAGQTSIYSLGSTDHRGRATVRAEQVLSTLSKPAPLVDVLLLSGQTVVARFPLVPGAPEILLAKASIDPILPAVSGQILALQEEVVDISARRKLLELRLRRAAGENQLERTKAIADEINALPNRAVFEEKLASIRKSVDDQSKTAKQASLGSQVKRLFLQTERLLNQVPQEKVVIETVVTPAEEGTPAPP